MGDRKRSGATGPRYPWMDRFHEFREDVEDGSMCLCGTPATYHDEWERRVLIAENEKLRGVIIDGAVDAYKRENNLT